MRDWCRSTSTCKRRIGRSVYRHRYKPLKGAKYEVKKDMSAKWQKQGLSYCPAGTDRHPKLLSHAANPLPILVEGDVYRVFFSGRDADNRSSVGAVDIDIVRNSVVQEHSLPFFQHGPPGSFYADGVSIGNCYEAGGVRYMLFMGWPDSILYDMEMLIQSAEKNRTLRSGNDMLTDMDSLCYKISGDQGLTDYYKQLDSMRRVYLEIQAERNYKTVASSTREYLTSIAISPEGKDKIKKSTNGFLTPICQVPFGLGGYRHTLP